MSGSDITRRAAWLVAHYDVHLVIQPIEAANQAVQRELSDTAGNNGRHVGLLEAKQDRRLGLGELAAFDDRTNFPDQLCLEQLFFGIGKAKVSENIAAASRNGGTW